MNEVADHINEFKRDHDDKLHLQDIQALLLNYEGPDLCSLGEFVLEGVMNQGKHTRFILLFHKLFILLKPHHDRLEVKHKIPTENLIVLEGSENNFSFSVQPFGDYNTKVRNSFFRKNFKTTISLLKLSFYTDNLSRSRIICIDRPFFMSKQKV
jgi:hypothetical protein